MNQKKLKKLYLLDINIPSHIQLYMTEPEKVDKKIKQNILSLQKEIKDSNGSCQVTLTFAQIEKSHDTNNETLEDIICEFEGYYDTLLKFLGENSINEQKSYIRANLPSLISANKTFTYSTNLSLSTNSELINFFHSKMKKIRKVKSLLQTKNLQSAKKASYNKFIRNYRKVLAKKIVEKSIYLKMDQNNITALVCIACLYGCSNANNIIKSSNFRAENALGDILLLPRLFKFTWSLNDVYKKNIDIHYKTNDFNLDELNQYINIVGLMPGYQYKSDWKRLFPNLYSKNMTLERNEIFLLLDLDETNERDELNMMRDVCNQILKP